jgi:hypothetical protein
LSTIHSIRLPQQHDASHTGIFADTGTGKTTAILQRLMQIEQRNETAVIWDVDRVYAHLFYKKDRGDVLLDVSLDEFPDWWIGGEISDNPITGEAEALSLGTCQFPDEPNDHDHFFRPASRQLYAFGLNKLRPTAYEFATWMNDENKIDETVKGTEFEAIISHNSPPMRAGVLAHLNTAAQAMRMMPRPEEKRPRFTIREWCKHRKGWIFITSKSSHADAMRPLHSMWVSTLIQKIVDMGFVPTLPRVHFIIDEAASLTLQAFHTALVRIRKTGCSVIYAVQNYADLEATHGKRAETIFSQPYTKIILRTSHAKSAEMLADTIGKNVYKRLEETVSEDRGKRSRSQRWHYYDEHPVKPIDIQNLPDLEGYLLIPGYVTKIKLPIIPLGSRVTAFKERFVDAHPEPKPKPNVLLKKRIEATGT